MYISYMSKLTSEQLNKINEMVKELKPLVSQIESQEKICKDHYDRYLLLLTPCSRENNKDHVKFMALALIMAGANTNGVQTAAKLLGVE